MITKWNLLLHNIKKDKDLLIIIMLPFLYYLIFHYLPMYGLLISFKDFSVSRGILGSDWVGFKWFVQFFQSIYFFRLFRNTFLLNFYDLIFGFPIPILFALLLNEIRHKYFKNVIQTVSYMPYFISLVVVVGIMTNILSPNDGLVNVIRKDMGLAPIAFMSDPSWFRFLYVSSGIWQGFGFSSIIYLAAIAGVPQEMYEAATIDGASRLKKIRYITFPYILPTIIIILILNLGGMLNVGFEKILLMYNPAVYETADVISTYVYRRGILSANYGYGAAVGMFNAVISFTFLIVFNKLSRKVSETSLW